MRRRVDFDEVDEAALVDLATGGTGIVATTGMRGGAVLAVQAFRDDACKRRLAHAAGAGKQQRMVQLVVLKRMGERAHHVRLANEFVETSWPPGSGKRLKTHALEVPVLHRCERWWVMIRSDTQRRRTAHDDGS